MLLSRTVLTAKNIYSDSATYMCIWRDQWCSSCTTTARTIHLVHVRLLLQRMDCSIIISGCRATVRKSVFWCTHVYACPFVLLLLTAVITSSGSMRVSASDVDTLFAVTVALPMV